VQPVSDQNRSLLSTFLKANSYHIIRIPKINGLFLSFAVESDRSAVRMGNTCDRSEWRPRTEAFAFRARPRECGPGIVIAWPTAGRTLGGLLTGALLPFLFSSYALDAVGRAAGRVVAEVRAQFEREPGILAGTTSPDYGRTVEILTKISLNQ